MSIALTRETYLPDAGEDLARVHDFLAARDAAGLEAAAPRYFLAGATVGEQVEIPREVSRVLRQVIEAMRHDLAVTVVPQAQTLTTQQAADLLGLSRPTVVKLLDDGKVPYQRTGTHRRILLHDLLRYREQRRSEQYAVLGALRAELDQHDEIENVDQVLAELKTARKTVAARRRARANQ